MAEWRNGGWNDGGMAEWWKGGMVAEWRNGRKNPKFFLGFSDPANFLHQPPSSLKKNPKIFFGFSDPANFLHVH
jgi:muramoyltetrapeptide carboxypeptidase LdcA involved in peptidoglycan recycling